MTKISNITDRPPAIPQKSVEKTQGDLFQRALEGAIQGGGKPAETAKAAPSPAAGSLGEIQATMMPRRVEAGTSDMAGTTDKLLTLLENYSQGLGNPDKTLKELEPLLADIKDSAKQLMEEAGGSQGDPRLTKIATETAMFANTEYIKFNRGDYI